jgi:hypothetical protein
MLPLSSQEFVERPVRLFVSSNLLDVLEKSLQSEQVSIPIRPTLRVLAASQFQSVSSSESLAFCRERASSDRELPSGVR